MKICMRYLIGVSIYTALLRIRYFISRRKRHRRQKYVVRNIYVNLAYINQFVVTDKKGELHGLKV